MAELKEYKPYELYNDTHAVWYKQKPAHWGCERFKYNFREKKKKNASELPAGSISFGEVIFKNEDNLSQDTKESYQEVLAGEFLINPLNLNFDLKSLRTALSTINVVVSTGYIVLQGCGLLHSRFARWLLQQFDVSHMKTLGAGVRQTINYADIGNSIFCRPTLEEQKVIAAFLDHETTKIDNLIEKQQQLIELLKEKRQAVISHAVTKGLNPDVPMKDSGVEWLGEVPEHWVPIQLGKVCHQVSDGPHFSPSYVDTGVMFISARNIKVNGWSLDDAKYITEKDYNEFCKRVIPELGDVLYTKGGTTGIARTVDIEDRFQIWVHVAVLKIIKSKAEPDFIAYSLNGTSCYAQSQLYTQGATNNDLGLTRMIKIWLALPPKNEQQKIVAFLNSITKKYDVITDKAMAAITILQERRTALISAAVTGKIDVRNWVASNARKVNVEVLEEATA